MNVIKEGHINLGYKDDNFIARIPPLEEVKKMIIQNCKDSKPDLKLTDSNLGDD